MAKQASPKKRMFPSDSIAQVIKGERDSLSKLLQALDEAIATVKKIRDRLDAISK